MFCGNLSAHLRPHSQIHEITMRIISLVPSLSDTIAHLGKRANIVGCTQFCVRPPDLHRTATIVGGTKDPNISLISDLVPDVIFVNTEENRAVDINACRKIAKTVETFPKSPLDVPEMILDIGRSIGAEGESQKLAHEVSDFIDRLNGQTLGERGRFIYLIWKNPYMVAGADTYISKMLSIAGFENVITSSERYPSMGLDEIRSLQPEVIFLSSEPYPFRKRDLPDFLDGWSVAPKIYKIDGQLLSWYGALTAPALQHFIEWPSIDPKFAQLWSG
jgi:iron complex transport system substrate-binding protein